MKIGVLTSSRADYGIYKRLLQKLKKDRFFVIEIIAFGTHLSKAYGYTIDHIVNDEYQVIHRLETTPDTDGEMAIAESYGKTVVSFSSFWNENHFDLIFCLGDRYEMSAAVQAAIPFNKTIVHIHGGETTLGAIDNVYRHQITIASKIHFASTEAYKQKIIQLTGTKDYIYDVGALSLDEIEKFKPLSKEELCSKFKIKNEPFILCTFHPETVALSQVYQYAKEMKNSLSAICKQINVVVTMPNADTFGSVFREAIFELKKENNASIFLVENFGKTYYFTAMSYCEFLLGNTSSGIIEAASFKKHVINVGNRQEGRKQSENTINAEFNSKDIIDKVNITLPKGQFNGDNVYYKPNSSNTIIKILKQLNDKF